jgi:FkbM family methyltransferase
MLRSLIVDVGMHRGNDTAFYLEKGFDVLAVEASPELAQAGRQRFSEYLSSGQLQIANVAIADFEGTIDFFACEGHDDWGTVSAEFKKRNEALGVQTRKITVPATRLETLLANAPTPHYIKIDIEGADFICLQSVGKLKHQPSLTSFERAAAEFGLLRDLGYTRFQIVNQALHHTVSLPNPAREGRYVDYQFDGFCTGPFGDELVGPWQSFDDAWRRYRRLLVEQRFFGAGGYLYQTRFQRAYERMSGLPVGWYDVHAAR